MLNGVDNECRRMVRTPKGAAALRERLIAMRDAALERMARRGSIELGHLPLIAGINAALDAPPSEVAEAERRWQPSSLQGGCSTP